jgi:hypothetical protein
MKMKHNLSNVPECRGCTEYDAAHGGSCNYGDDEWFTCPKVTEHIESMRKELKEIIRKQDYMMQKIPKHLRGKGHWINIEAILGCSE